MNLDTALHAGEVLVAFAAGIGVVLITSLIRRAKSEQRIDDNLQHVLTIDRAREIGFLTRDEQEAVCNIHRAEFNGEVNLLKAQLGSQASLNAGRFEDIKRQLDVVQATMTQILNVLLALPKRSTNGGDKS